MHILHISFCIWITEIGINIIETALQYTRTSHQLKEIWRNQLSGEEKLEAILKEKHSKCNIICLVTMQSLVLGVI